MNRSVFPLWLFSSLMIAFFLSINACGKKGINEGLDPNAQKPYDFMSTKKGSYWHYGSRAGVSYKRFAREKDSVKNGLLYSYYERQEDTGAGLLTPEYFGKNGTYYVTLLDLEENGSTPAPDNKYLEYVYWKEDATKGSSWQNTGTVNHSSVGDVRLYTSSKEIDDNLTLVSGNKTYTGVVHVHSDLRTVTFNTRIGTLDMWFVKNIGVIRQEAHINILGAFTKDHVDSLIDYYIQP